MLRFVVSPDRALIPDLSARLPGRGIWLSARRDVLENGRLRGAVARAARGPVDVPVHLAAFLEDALARRAGELIGLARRAGQAVAGFDKAREWVRFGRAGLVVAARDGSTEERLRLLSGASVSVVSPLDAALLGAVFGRERVVHVALLRGRLAGMVADEAARLAGVAGEEAPATGAETKPAPAGDYGRPGRTGQGAPPDAAGARSTGRNA